VPHSDFGACDAGFAFSMLLFALLANDKHAKRFVMKYKYATIKKSSAGAGFCGKTRFAMITLQWNQVDYQKKCRRPLDRCSCSGPLAFPLEG